MGKKYNSFDEYYEFYLSKHKNPLNRFLHLLGNIATIAFVVSVFKFDLSLWWLLLTPFVVYPLAALGHLICEGNMPAFLSGNPIYAKMSDWKMLYQWLTGKLK
jgi:hypothetical protein